MAGMVRFSRSRGFEGCLLAALLLLCTILSREDSWHPSLALASGPMPETASEARYLVGWSPSRLSASDSVSLGRLSLMNSGLHGCGQEQGRSAACPLL